MSGTFVGPGGTLGNVETLSVAGRNFVNLTPTTGLLTLQTIVNAAQRYGTSRLGNATAGYTPSGSNRFRVQAVKFRVNSPSAQLFIGYGDNDVGIGVNTAPTTPVYMAGIDPASTYGNIVWNSSTSIPTNTVVEVSIDFIVPNGKFLFFDADGNTTALVFAYGYEIV